MPIQTENGLESYDKRGIRLKSLLSRDMSFHNLPEYY